MFNNFWWAFPLAYILGSIPTAVWWGKAFYGVDVRQQGSGNSGATNTFRVLGRKAGIPVLLIDMLKGFLACKLVWFGNQAGLAGSNDELLLMVLLGMVAIIGHLYPVFAGFRGGKGVATSFGMVLALEPTAAGVALAVFLLVFGLSHYVSLGSLTAAFSFPIVTLLILQHDKMVMVVFSLVLACLVVLTHRKNIVRLLNGTENKIYLFGRRN